ncbi:MAG TPA: hypothetical protein PJ988_14870, partial [Anaerolinea sp.]|nr:hypothetical protein [Anaerolinea sp.]
MGGGLEASQREVAKSSARDAARLPAYYARLERVADVLRDRQRVNLYLGMLGGFLLGALIWPVYNWVAAGSPLADTYRLYWPYDGVGFGPQFGRGGHTQAGGLQNVYGGLFDFNTLAM